MGGYNRPEGGWRLNFQGIKTNSTADALQPTKYPYAQNVRMVQDQSVQTRAGYALITTGAAVPVTDIRAYSTLDTDNLPRSLSRNSNNQIYLDTGTLVATLSGSGRGACMIPYRPNQSPQSWMYVGTLDDYQKLSAPDSSNAITAYKVGIKEQQAPPLACPQSFAIYEFTGLAAAWTQGGTAGVPANGNRLAASTIIAIFADPGSGSDIRYSLETQTADSYQIGMLVVLDAAGGNYHTVVQDVVPPIDAGTTITIASIYYFAGTTGRCIIIPVQMPASAMTPDGSQDAPQAASLYSDNVIASLRRGAIVLLDNGGGTTEKCFVRSATRGPDGTISFEVSTTNTFAAGHTITGRGCIIVTGANGVVANDTIVAASVTSAITTGTGTLSNALGTNPFIQQLNPTNKVPQMDDYVIIGVNISNLANFVIGKVIFKTDAGAAYDVNGFYAQFTANDMIFHEPAATQVTESINDSFDPNSLDSSLDGNAQPQPEVIVTTTPLPASQWTTILIPIRTLVRIGNDLTKSLANCNGVQISVQVTGAVTLAIAGFVIAGSGQVDAGATGSPYFYFVRGRNSITGAKSNPSPVTRYGVSPRRQSVLITMTDDSADSQMDTWDVFRFGGSINSFRYIGSTKNTGGADTFTDNYFDTSANAGSAAEYDNFEPWPTIDVPFSIVAGLSGLITTTITAYGTIIYVSWTAAGAFTNPAPSTILRWLPGTLVSLGGQAAYTLYKRPELVSSAANSYVYRFEIVENAGSSSPTTLQVNEPNVARQTLPYLWGPDAQGTIFAAGDVYRPGSFYYCKAFNPDSAPDKYNQELTPPSEPLIGGEVLNGISFAASTQRWWGLYPNFGSGNRRYQAVERPVGRGLAAPYAHCTDGKNIYFVAKDGVWISPGGGAGASLTDEDLFNLFPHDGVNTPVNYTYGTYTIYAPDYAYAADFRLAFNNSYLYFDYKDSSGSARTLVCDLRDVANPAWSVDDYGDVILCHYGVEQQEGVLETTGTKYPMLLMGDSGGKVYKQQDLTNDDGIPISGVISTFEYNGGDIRADQLFNDAFLDLVPVSGVQASPMQGGAAAVSAVTIPVSATRIQTNIIVGLELKYMGVLLTWTDNFSSVSTPTKIHTWQPMYQAVPVSVFQWKTQGTSFGWMAYGHIRQINFCYKSTADVTLTITVYDGTSPAVITLPSTGGAVRKIMFPLTFNKGMLYFFTGVSSAEWSPYLGETEIYTGEWGRTGPYELKHDIEAATGIRS